MYIGLYRLLILATFLSPCVFTENPISSIQNTIQPTEDPNDTDSQLNSNSAMEITGELFPHIEDLECTSLQMGQYYCDHPVIDSSTQQAKNCSVSRLVKVPCYPVKGMYCSGKLYDGATVGFYQEVTCKYTTGHEFSVALLLSVFLGWLGIDRFYLGYPALGLVKLCTFGFMFLGQLIDMLLIAIQVVGPADGSDYVVDYYGAGLTRIEGNNFTFVRPPEY